MTNLMKLTDDEIRSKCKARYHASPEPVHDDSTSKRTEHSKCQAHSCVAPEPTLAPRR